MDPKLTRLVAAGDIAARYGAINEKGRGILREWIAARDALLGDGRMSLRSVTPKARATDPSTSRDAALRNQPRAGTQRAKLLAAVKSARFNGMTAEEAAYVSGIRLNSASTRMSELMRGGHIVESATLTRKTSGGEKAIVYLAVDLVAGAGQEAVSVGA